MVDAQHILLEPTEKKTPGLVSDKDSSKQDNKTPTSSVCVPT